MKTYELDASEIGLVLSALRYTAEYGYTAELTDGEIDEYSDILALIEKLDPKPVQKEGWMVVWSDGGKSCIFDTWEEADARYQNYRETGKIIKVTWEE